MANHLRLFHIGAREKRAQFLRCADQHLSHQLRPRTAGGALERVQFLRVREPYFLTDNSFFHAAKIRAALHYHKRSIFMFGMRKTYVR
jgi:hypothetical protein